MRIRSTAASGKLYLLAAIFTAAGLIADGADAANYTAQSGDSLWSVASANNISVDELRKANHMGKRATLVKGQVLIVPGDNAAPVTAAPRKTESTPKAAVAKLPASNRKPVIASQRRVPQLASSSAIVVDANTGQTLFSKNTNNQMPIASITKLMTAMVVLDANPSMQEVLTIDEADVDNLKHTTSRMQVGTRLPRYDMLRLALMSSENRAASSLSRHYPGGKQAFVNAMRIKAAKLGMTHTQFYDPTGLTPANVSTAEDLVKMVKAASQYDLIHDFTTTPSREVAMNTSRQPLPYLNTNLLVREGDWDIAISKTGYINEAGHCLVMLATVANRPSVMVFLEAEGKFSPVGDANRLKNWIEGNRGNADQLAMADTATATETH